MCASNCDKSFSHFLVLLSFTLTGIELTTQQQHHHHTIHEKKTRAYRLECKWSAAQQKIKAKNEIENVLLCINWATVAFHIRMRWWLFVCVKFVYSSINSNKRSNIIQFQANCIKLMINNIERKQKYFCRIAHIFRIASLIKPITPLFSKSFPCAKSQKNVLNLALYGNEWIQRDCWKQFPTAMDDSPCRLNGLCRYGTKQPIIVIDMEPRAANVSIL